MYIKHLGEDAELRYDAERFWYLGSAVKVPIALAVLQGVDDDEFRLDQRLTLEAEDKVDGSGDLVWQDNGVDYCCAICRAKCSSKATTRPPTC